MIAVFLTLSAFSQIAAHWAPLARIIGRPLPKPIAYVIGVLGILLPYSVYMGVFQGVWWEVWYFVLASGIATILAYVVDYMLHLHARAKDAEELESYVAKDDR